MELHPGRVKGPGLRELRELPLGEFYLQARDWVGDQPELARQLAIVRERRPEHLTPDIFWPEYVWVVYVGGLSARVVGKRFGELMEAFGPWDSKRAFELAVMNINRNRSKLRACRITRDYLQTMGWPRFKAEHLSSPGHMMLLPNIGPITRWHLARNLGFDVVKPDIHLQRLAQAYGFPTPASMCGELGRRYNERVGAVDLILWAYCAAVGTL
jgi:hypothetical protein